MRFAALLLSAMALCLAAADSARAQSACQTVAQWSPCEIVVELSDAAVKAHPNPTATVDVWAEFRSPAPKYHTRRLPAYWDGGRRMVIRFTPDDPGLWTWRVSGNLAEWDGKEGQVTVTATALDGFLRPANLHFWWHPETLAPHLYLGDRHDDLFTMERSRFDQLLAARARQKFTHIGGTVLTPVSRAFSAPDQPNIAFFTEMDARIKAIHERGLATDIVLAPSATALAAAFPKWEQRERFLRYVLARYDAYNVSWEMVAQFEGASDNRNLVKELGQALRRYDPYNHPGTSGAATTSSPLLGDKWVSHVVQHSPDPALGAIEHQRLALPSINTGFAPLGVTGEAFRGALWNATMNGQSPVTSLDALDSADTKALETWAETMDNARYWELEPYFEIDGGRAVALPGVEYLVYLDKPGPLSLLVEKHSYDVWWINPATGERTKEKKDWKGEEFTGAPPDSTHDWLLHLSRDGHKVSMRKSYKFESQFNQLQEAENSPAHVPFVLETPKADETTLVAGTSVPFQINVKKPTKGTRRMLYLITGEVVLDGAGARVLCSGDHGQLTVPAEMLRGNEGVMNVRVEGLNAAGKLYVLDLVFPVKRTGK